MTPETLSPPAVLDGITERFDPIACLDEQLRQRAGEGVPDTPGRYLLIEGPERTVVIDVCEDTIHIGRGLSAELHLDEKTVSRRHAILVPSPAGPRLLDDRSSNGTYVNGRRVQQAELSSGDVILIGRVLLRYLEV